LTGPPTTAQTANAVGPEWIVFLFLVVVPVLCGVVTMNLAAGKGRTTSGEKLLWFLFGFFFPLIGLIVAAVIGPKQGAPPIAPPPPPPPLP
jgi:hypothetical protein